MDLPYFPAGTGWAVWSAGASSTTSSEQENGPPLSPLEQKGILSLKFGLRPRSYLDRSLYRTLILIRPIRKPDGPVIIPSGPINQHIYSLPNFECHEYSPHKTDAAAMIYMVPLVPFFLSPSSGKTGQKENSKRLKNPGGKNKPKEPHPGFERKDAKWDDTTLTPGDLPPVVGHA
jgi:hypothetical protein